MVFHSVTLAKKNIPPEFPQTRDEFPEEKGIHLVVPDAPPLPKDFISSRVHTPKRAAAKFEQSLESPTYKAGEPITVGPKRLPDSPFLKQLSPTPYHKSGTPYRKVDPPGEIEPETLGAGILDKADDSFEVDPESERTLTEEPKTPRFEKNVSEMPEGITKRKLAPTILLFTDKGPKSKIESKAIVRLKKIDAKTDIERKPLIEKGPETKVKVIEKPVGNPRKGPVKSPEVTAKRLEATKKPHEKPLKEVAVTPPAPVVRSPPKSPSISPVRTPGPPSPLSSPPSSVPSSPVSPIVVGPVAIRTVEEIKNALIE